MGQSCSTGDDAGSAVNSAFKERPAALVERRLVQNGFWLMQVDCFIKVRKQTVPQVGLVRVSLEGKDLCQRPLTPLESSIRLHAAEGARIW